MVPIIPVQLTNAAEPITLSIEPAGNVRVLIPVSPNAYSPIVSSDAGKVTLDKFI